MENKLNNIDHLFKDGLGGYSETPPPDVWDALEKRLDERNKRPGMAFRWPWFIALLFVAGVFSALLALNMSGNSATKALGKNSDEKTNADAQKTSSEAAAIVTHATAGNNNTAVKEKLQKSNASVIKKTYKIKNNRTVNSLPETAPKTSNADQSLAANLPSAKASAGNAATINTPAAKSDDITAQKTVETKYELSVPTTNKYVVKNKVKNNIMVSESEPTITGADNAPALLASVSDEDEEDQVTFGKGGTSYAGSSRSNQFIVSTASVAPRAANTGGSQPTAVTGSNSGKTADKKPLPTTAKATVVTNTPPTGNKNTTPQIQVAAVTAKVSTAGDKAKSGNLATTTTHADAGTANGVAPKPASGTPATTSTAKVITQKKQYNAANIKKHTNNNALAIAKAKPLSVHHPVLAAAQHHVKINKAMASKPVAVAPKTVAASQIGKRTQKTGVTAQKQIAHVITNPLPSAKPAIQKSVAGTHDVIAAKNTGKPVKHNVAAVSAAHRAIAANIAKKPVHVATAPKPAVPVVSNTSVKKAKTHPTQHVMLAAAQKATSHIAQPLTHHGDAPAGKPKAEKAKVSLAKPFAIAVAPAEENSQMKKVGKATQDMVAGKKPSAEKKDKQYKPVSYANAVASAARIELLADKKKPVKPAVSAPAQTININFFSSMLQLTDKPDFSALTQGMMKDRVMSTFRTESTAPEKTAITEKKADAPVTDSSKAKQHFLPGYVYGLKIGYEAGFNSNASQKAVVSGFIEHTLKGKFSYMLQPAIKSSHVASRSLSGTETFYDTAASTMKNENYLLILVNGLPYYRHNFTFTQNYDSIVKSYGIGGSYVELELPVMLKYNFTDRFSVYGGVNISYSKFIPIKETTFKSGPLTATAETLSVSQQYQPTTAPAASSVLSYTGSHISDYKGPLYPTPPGSSIRLGYMLGVSYEFKKRWLVDGLIQQSSAKPNVQGGYNTNATLSMPYFRFTLGYRLSK